MNTTAAPTWSKPHHGVQHLGRAPGHHDTTGYWCSVEEHGDMAVLCCWFPGCDFRPKFTQHASIAKARAAGERYLREHTP